MLGRICQKNWTSSLLADARLQPKGTLEVNGCMPDSSQEKTKPVAPTNEPPSSTASNPREVRAERPPPQTQSAGTPDGGGGQGSPGIGKPRQQSG